MQPLTSTATTAPAAATSSDQPGAAGLTGRLSRVLRREFLTNAACPLLVFLIVGSAWLPALQNGLVWDDYFILGQTAERHSIQAAADFFLKPVPGTPYVRPLNWLSFYADDLIWGPDRPRGWHLDNVVLHAANAALLVIAAAGLGPLGSTAAGLVFGLHPLHTETVGAIFPRHDLLGTSFVLLSVIAFARGRSRWSVAAFAAALLTKEAALALPAIFAGWLLWRREPLTSVRGHLIALGAYGVYRLIVASDIGQAGWDPEPGAWLFRPWLALAYPLPFSVGGRWPEPGVLPGWLWWLGAVGCTLILAAVGRSLRRTWPLLVALLIAFLPVLPLFQLGPSFQFGRFLYLPALIWGVLVGAALVRHDRPLALGVLSLYAISLAVLSLPARQQFYEAGATADRIVRQIVDLVPEPPTTRSIWVEGIPPRVNGWGIFGDYLGVALSMGYQAQNRARPPDVPVVDIAWKLEVREPVPEPAPTDVFLSWDAASRTFTRVTPAPQFTGKLRLVTDPPAEVAITANGRLYGRGTLDWVQLPPGGYRLGLQDFFGRPVPSRLRVRACGAECEPIREQPATEEINIRAFETTEVSAALPELGLIQIAPGFGMLAPRLLVQEVAGDWGAPVPLLPGRYDVALEELSGPFGTRRACSAQVAVSPGTVTSIRGDSLTGSCIVTQLPIGVAVPGDLQRSNAGSKGASTANGLLRVFTDPAVPTEISVDGVSRGMWALDWLEFAPGEHRLSLGAVGGYAMPQTLTVQLCSQACTTPADQPLATPVIIRPNETTIVRVAFTPAT